jgi:transglutaminase-like putative cysteine protease
MDRESRWRGAAPFALLFAIVALAGEGPAPAPLPGAGEKPAPEPGLVAERRYEQLVHGRRAAVLHVKWYREERDGEPVLRDVTRVRARTIRIMGRVRDVFESDETTTAVRTEEGDLLALETLARQGEREDRIEIRRVDGGYKVRRSVGDNAETFTIAAAESAKLDAEAFLGERIRRREAAAGTSWTCSMLDLEGRRVVTATLVVEGPDAEGPGLRVRETRGERVTLWWFDDEGAVARLRTGDVVVRRDDALDFEHPRARPAAFRVTIPADRSLPRAFTAREMLVELRVRTDETVRVPVFASSPFTEEVERGEGFVRLRLKSHDDPGATTALPVRNPSLAAFLKPTPWMEVDDPEVVAAAARAAGGATDARTAAARIGTFVFESIEKASTEIAELTAKEILRRGAGDCSEHATLFCALARAAGIPTRRCSGWAYVGEDWGAHAWCEIFVGKWIGVDPTTNEIGTRARYVLCAREEDADRPAAAIAAERTEIAILRAEYDDGVADFAAGGKVSEKLLSGIRVKLPGRGWKARWAEGRARISGPGLLVEARLEADHGYRSIDVLRRLFDGGERASFGGRPALRWGDVESPSWIVPLGRENLHVQAHATGDGAVDPERVASLLAPTLER